MIFELEEAGGSLGQSKPGDWDRFRFETLASRSNDEWQRRMAAMPKDSSLRRLRN